MGNDDTKNMKVKKEDLKKARCLHFGERCTDWQIFRKLLFFLENHPKEFEKWKEKTTKKEK